MPQYNRREYRKNLTVIGIDLTKLPNNEPILTKEMLKKAYHKASLEHHPDKLTNASAEQNEAQKERMQEINSARNYLNENFDTFSQEAPLTYQQYIDCLEELDIKPKQIEKSAAMADKLIESQYIYLVNLFNNTEARGNFPHPEKYLEHLAQVRDDLLDNLYRFSEPYKLSKNFNGEHNSSSNQPNAADAYKLPEQTADDKKHTNMYLVIVSLNTNSNNFDPLALKNNIEQAQEVKVFYSLPEAQTFLSEVKITNAHQAKAEKLNQFAQASYIAKGMIYQVDNKTLAGDTSLDEIDECITGIFQQKVKKISSSDQKILENFLKPTGAVSQSINKLVEKVRQGFLKKPSDIMLSFKSKDKYEEKSDRNALVEAGIALQHPIFRPVARAFFELKNSLMNLKSVSNKDNDYTDSPKFKM